MGLEEVRKEVLSKARNEAAALLAQAQKQVEEEKATLNALIRERKKTFHDSLEKERARLEETREAEGKSAAADLLLKAKHEVMTQVMEKAKESLMKGEKKYVKNLLAFAEKQMKIEKVFCSKNAEKHLSGCGYKVITADIQGIVAEGKDGKVSLDLTFDMLLSRLKEKYLNEIAGVLLK